jgi:hypothetical protein
MIGSGAIMKTAIYPALTISMKGSSFPPLTEKEKEVLEH